MSGNGIAASCGKFNFERSGCKVFVLSGLQPIHSDAIIGMPEGTHLGHTTYGKFPQTFPQPETMLWQDQPRWLLL